MNLKFLSKLAKEHPAIARLLEAMIYSVICYLVTGVISWANGGDFVTFQGSILSLFTPLSLALSKYKRDLDKK